MNYIKSDYLKMDCNRAFFSWKCMFVFCKPFLDKVAKHFWTLLHVQIGLNCKVLVSLIKQADHSLADII